jgi:hypothetical protein
MLSSAQIVATSAGFAVLNIIGKDYPPGKTSSIADVPTPAGPTQKQLGAKLVQVTSIRQVAMAVAQDGGANVCR